MVSSNWMRNLFGQGRKQIEAQVTSAIAAGVWGISGQIKLEVWNADSYRWFTERDEKVCELCKPMEGMLIQRSELYVYPRHWACRCALLPDNTG